MEKSETLGKLASALVGFQGEMHTVVFDASNPFFKSKYATLAQLVGKAKDILSKHGLAVSQLIEDDGAVTTILMHSSGEYLVSKVKLTPVKNDPQGVGSAITYSRRYAYAAILGLVADADDDGNEATGLKKESKVEPTPEPAKPITLKDRVIGTAQTKFKNMTEFQAWRVNNSLAENLDKASETDLNFILAVMREYNPKAK